MKRFVLGFLFLVITLPAVAIERGSPAEARHLAERAAEYLLEHGADVAITEFSNSGGDFVDRDLYVFVLDKAGNLLAHGNNRHIIGKNLWKMRDVDGQLITQNAIATALSEQAGWTPVYRFPDPLTKKIGTKRSYVIHVENLVIGVGFYSYAGA